jgi:hypothetical protein
VIEIAPASTVGIAEGLIETTVALVVSTVISVLVEFATVTFVTDSVISRVVGIIL